MREINKIAEGLFEKIRDRFEDVSLGDENANATQNPENARFFNFDYIVDGTNHGNVTLSVVDETSLKAYFSKNISNNLDDQERKQWYGFLRELREFAKRNLLSFEPRDITRSTLKHRDIQQVSKADSTYDKDEVIGESRLYGTSRSSYENDGPVRIIIRHSDHVDSEKRGDRSRKIRAIYLENADGERLKLPHNSLRYARAMARHCAEGGSINDEFGQHITELAEECSKLKPFKASMIRRVFEDDETQRMVEAAFEYHGLLKDTLNKMGGRKGYTRCKEQFTATSTSYIPEQELDIDSLKERFVKRTYNERMDDALPIVHKAYNMKKTNKFAQQFESWANTVAEEWDNSIDVDDLAEMLSDPIPFGVDAINATTAIEGIINNDEFVKEMEKAAKEDPDADARDFILFWLEQNEPMVYQQVLDDIGDQEPADQYGSADGGMDGQVTEGDYDEDTYDEDNVEAVQTAILRRILSNISQHGELLRAVGPDGVMNAARDVASFHAPVDELGSSDISIMVREVYQEAGVEFPELNEGRVKELEMDLEELTDAEFVAKYNKTKAEMRAGLTEAHGDYVDRDEKLKRAGAKELSTWDKIKMMPRQAKAMAKGDSEDDLVNYNKQFNEEIAQMRKIAGLK